MCVRAHVCVAFIVSQCRKLFIYTCNRNLKNVTLSVKFNILFKECLYQVAFYFTGNGYDNATEIIKDYQKFLNRFVKGLYTTTRYRPSLSGRFFYILSIKTEYFVL